MIQLLPSSYNQKRTVMLNYEVLANIYKSRRNHKLDEWHTLCDWIERLPYSELITGEKKMTDRGKGILNKAYQQGWLSGFDFSLLIQDMTISENGYVIDTGNWENVNAEVALRLAEQIKKHPILWKLFFMIA